MLRRLLSRLRATADRGDASDRLYLDRLEFRPELRRTWLNFFVTNFRAVLLLIVLIAVWGVYSFLNLPRELNPEVKIPIAVVAVGYPGAAPFDVEELVTKKLETKIAALSGVSSITSTSANSSATVTVEFEAGEDLDESVRRLSDKVKEAELPEDATEPRVIEISFSDQPVFTAALSGSVDEFTLRARAEDVKDRLEQLPGVREVRISGGAERELEIAYDPDRLAYHGVALMQANGAVQAANANFPAGLFEGETHVYPIRADARFWNAEELAAVPVKVGAAGEVVYLRDVADVREVAAAASVRSRVSIAGGPARPAVTVEVLKRTGGSIVDVAEASRAIIDETVAGMPGLAYDVTVNQAELIAEDFDRLQHDFLLTLALVAGVLILLIGLKEAFVASLAIPLVFFVTFGVMRAQGLSLNFLSVFSLLLSLGMLVDDAIVVVSATKMYLRSGKFTPEEAVLLVLNDFKLVLTTTTLTTVWAFVPLLLATGIIGSFIQVIPIAVSVTLVASLLIALMVNHPLAAVLERLRPTRPSFWLAYLTLVGLAAALLSRGSVIGYVAGGLVGAAAVAMVRWYFRGGAAALKAGAALMRREWRDDELIKRKLRGDGHGRQTMLSRLVHGVFSLDAVLPYYGALLRAVFATRFNRLLTLGAVSAALVFAVTLLAAGVVRSEFFPASDEGTLYLNYRGPVGLKLDVTDERARVIEAALRAYPEIVNFQTFVGMSQGDDGGGTSPELFSMVINLVDDAERPEASYELADRWRAELTPLLAGVGGDLSVSSPSGGPPAGAAFEARVSGQDLAGLASAVAGLKRELETIPGVVDARSSLREAPAEYTFRLDPDQLERNGLSAAAVSGVLRTAVSGTDVTSVFREAGEVKVVARFAEAALPDLSSLQGLAVLNARGERVFLKDLGAVELAPSVQAVTRIDQKRTVSLTAGVGGGALSADVLAAFQAKLAARPELVPAGYEIAYGGENEESAESVRSILVAMVLALFLIAATMVVQFASFRQALFVLAAIPLSLIGVFSGLAVTGITLSFPGLIGVLALFGIVVKNSIILVDKMNLNVRSGIPFVEAVIDAGKSRLEAIFITSLCTMLGILPITLSNEMWRSLGSSIIFGLMASSLLTLLVIPTLYVQFARRPDEQ
jgi:multidrug efflux pump subunit AcrB